MGGGGGGGEQEKTRENVTKRTIDRSPCRVYANDRATSKLGFTQSKNGWCRAGG